MLLVLKGPDYKNLSFTIVNVMYKLLVNVLHKKFALFHLTCPNKALIVVVSSFYSATAS